MPFGFFYCCHRSDFVVVFTDQGIRVSDAYLATYICECPLQFPDMQALGADILLCASIAQAPALLALFSNTDGPNWINNTGWPGGTDPLPPETCMGEGNASLPDHCCWYGVSCCTCTGADSSCTCMNGTVIGLRLSANNVRPAVHGAVLPARAPKI